MPFYANLALPEKCTNPERKCMRTRSVCGFFLTWVGSYENHCFGINAHTFLFQVGHPKQGVQAEAKAELWPLWRTAGDRPSRYPCYDPNSYVVNTSNSTVRRNHSQINVAPNSASPSSSNVRNLIREPIMTRSHTGTPVAPPDRLWNQEREMWHNWTIRLNNL